MDPVLLSLVAGLVGLAIGVAGMLAFRASEAQRRVRLDADEPVLPKGAADVLSVVGRAYVIVDGIDGVVRASPAAYAFGLVRGHTVVHDELLELTARVRRDGVIEERQLVLEHRPPALGRPQWAGAVASVALIHCYQPELASRQLRPRVERLARPVCEAGGHAARRDQQHRKARPLGLVGDLGAAATREEGHVVRHGLLQKLINAESQTSKNAHCCLSPIAAATAVS